MTTKALEYEWRVAEGKYPVIELTFGFTITTVETWRGRTKRIAVVRVHDKTLSAGLAVGDKVEFNGFEWAVESIDGIAPETRPLTDPLAEYVAAQSEQNPERLGEPTRILTLEGYR